MFGALDKISRFYTKVLLEAESAEPALEYIRSRGFTDTTIKEFGIGYSPTTKVNYVQKKYLTYTDVENLVDVQHLFKNSDKKFSDRFTGRLMFPVKKPNGKVSGFAARSITGDLPKYLNSAESYVYKKAHVLFGLDQAKEHIYAANRAIICEGYTDAMAFHQSGIKIAVACGGTYATSHQIAQIARYTDNIYLAFDADSAGDAVSNATYMLLKNMGLKVGFIDIPRGKDPADVLLT